MTGDSFGADLFVAPRPCVITAAGWLAGMIRRFRGGAK